jgi:D-alanine transaminase
MPLPICYLNGDYLPLAEARVSPLDRAFLFGDAVYEVLPVYASRPFRLREHLDRLNRSLAGIRMPPPLAHGDWAKLCLELIARNSAREAYLYLQVTRGAEFGRNHAWPEDLNLRYVRLRHGPGSGAACVLEQGVAAVTAADIRWARRDIKSTALLANILLKKLSADAGAFETIMLENGELTEGLIDHRACRQGRRHSHAAQRASHLARHHPRCGHRTRRPPAAAQREPPRHRAPNCRAADEIWLAFATRGVLPVTTLDGAKVGTGRPGPLFKRMSAAFADYTRELAATPAL